MLLWSFLAKDKSRRTIGGFQFSCVPEFADGRKDKLWGPDHTNAFLFEIALESGSKRNVLVWKVENASKPQYGRRVCSYHVHRVQLTSQRVDSRKRVKTVAWTWIDFRWQRKSISEWRVLVVVWDTWGQIGAIRSVFFFQTSSRCSRQSMGFSFTRYQLYNCLVLVAGRLQWYWRSRVLGIPIPKTLLIWASSSHITLAIWVRVAVDAHITRVLGMGMPISPWHCPHKSQ